MVVLIASSEIDDCYTHHNISILQTMNNAKSTVAATGTIGAAASKIRKVAAAAGNISDGVAGKTKTTKRTYGGRGMGLMKRPNGQNVARGFGRGGKHKFSGKLRPRSPSSKPMRLSRRLSWNIQRGSPLRSPISAVMLNWTPTTRHGDLKKRGQPVVEEGAKTPDAKED